MSKNLGIEEYCDVQDYEKIWRVGRVVKKTDDGYIIRLDGMDQKYDMVDI